MGWRNRLWRIWSTDWFRNPRGESERLFAFLEGIDSQSLPNEEPPPRANDASHVPPSSPAVAAAIEAIQRKEPNEEGLLFDVEEEDLVIEAGDAVTIYRLGSPPETAKRIKVTEGHSDLGNGFVSPGDEFGAALLGAAVGEHVVVRPAGREPKTYVVKNIEREDR